MSGNAKILIADDEPAIQKVLAICCRQAGYEATVVDDGLEALALAFWNSYQLIITDYQMPRMNGADLCRHLRSYERHEQTPIILCSSAIAELETDAIKREVGWITFVSKPIDLRSFSDLLQRLLTTSTTSAV